MEKLFLVINEYLTNLSDEELITQNVELRTYDVPNFGDEEMDVIILCSKDLLNTHLAERMKHNEIKDPKNQERAWKVLTGITTTLLRN